MEDHPEPTSDALARAAQVVAVTVTIAEAIARLRAQRDLSRARTEEHRARVTQATDRLHDEHLRLAWRPALHPPSLREMSATEALTAWAAAQQHSDDPNARRAASAVEERLRAVHPEAMTLYDEERRHGADSFAAMQAAVGSFRGEYGLDEPGTPLGRLADALDEQSRSALRADDPTTSRLDEGTTTAARPGALRAESIAVRHMAEGLRDHGMRSDGATESSGPLGRLTAATPRQSTVRVLHVRAFPVSTHDAMATAPHAARAALPAAPTRRALTATSTHRR